MHEQIIQRPDATLLLRIWPAKPESRACICLVHGLGEHSGRYRHVAEYFNQAGFSVGAVDLRGHGRSSGRRGDCKHYSILLDDIQDVLDFLVNECPNQPLILYGHSFGGNLVLNYAVRRESSANLLLATSPMLRTAQPVSVWKRVAGHLLKHIAPGFRLRNGIDLNDLSSDPEIGKEYRSDELNHPFVSVRMAYDMIESGSWAISHAGLLRQPLLLMHGTDDRITSRQASAEFAEHAAKLCTFKLWPGMRHELHNEVDRESVLRYILDWIDDHLNKNHK